MQSALGAGSPGVCRPALALLPLPVQLLQQKDKGLICCSQPCMRASLQREELAAPCSALSWDSSPGLVPSPEVSNFVLIMTTIVMIYWMSQVMKSIFSTFELNSAVQHESIVRVDSANLRVEELEILPQSHLQQLLRARTGLPPVGMDSVTLPLSVVWDSLQARARACGAAAAFK